MAEARRLFPQSVGLNRLESEYDRRGRNFDGAVTVMQRLVELDPQQKVNWLTEIVRVREEQGRLDEAVAATGPVIAAAPTAAAGYLLAAQIAFDAGEPTWRRPASRKASGQTDTPNAIRRRLGSYWMEAGQPAKARAVYEEAYAAADTPAERLAMVRLLAQAYFLEGRLEDLLARFRQEQTDEDDNGRNGTTLAAIYEEIEDHGGARRELAKALAARPRDTALLKSLIDLATKDGASEELIQYREALAAADPSGDNQVALAMEYARQNRPEDAWRLVQANAAEITKNPLPWKELLNQMGNRDIADQIRARLEEALTARGSNSVTGKFALGQFQVQGGDFAGAQKTFWETFAAATSGQSFSVASPPIGTGSASAPPGQLDSALSRRVARANDAIDEARQFVRSGLAHQVGAAPGTNNPTRRPGSGGTVAALDATGARDQSLVYLSTLALQQDRADAFLGELQDRLTAQHRSRVDRLVAYASVEAREPLLSAIEEQARDGPPDREADEFCFVTCDRLLRLAAEPAYYARVEAAQATLLGRLESDSNFRRKILLERALADDNQTPAGLARRQTAAEAFLKGADRHDPAELIDILKVSARQGDWAGMNEATAALLAMDGLRNRVALRPQLDLLPSVFFPSGKARSAVPPDLPAVLLKLMRLGYPRGPPRGRTARVGLDPVAPGRSLLVQSVFPVVNRFFTGRAGKDVACDFQPVDGSARLLPAIYVGPLIARPPRWATGGAFIPRW